MIEILFHQKYEGSFGFVYLFAIIVYKANMSECTMSKSGMLNLVAVW